MASEIAARVGRSGRRAGYRVWQFLRAVGDRRAVAPAELDGLLGPAEADLFRRLSPSDQRHSLAVMRYLRRRGVSDRTLLRAALLHDVGKGAGRVWLWQRVGHVLARAFAPRVADWLARAPGGWRTGFWVLANHERLGAEMLARHGVEPALVALVGRDRTAADRAHLEQLDEADSTA